MPLELDHVFSFCDPALTEAAVFQKQGLTVSDGRAHPGQGTAMRGVMFEENYFEMIYLASEEEARANSLKLDRRANWRTSGASPFGIALRGELSDTDRARFWAYRPPYAPGVVIWIHEANEKSPELPMIFVMEYPNSPSLADVKPRVRFQGKDVLRHALGSTRIDSLIALGRGARWPLAEKVEGVRFEPAPRPHLHLHIDGNAPGNFAINELCSFAIA